MKAKQKTRSRSCVSRRPKRRRARGDAGAGSGGREPETGSSGVGDRFRGQLAKSRRKAMQFENYADKYQKNR